MAPPQVVRVVVSPAADSVIVGEITQLSATVLDGSGNPLVDRPIVWSSGNIGLASVTPDGLVTGVAAGGPVSVTATSEAKSGIALVTVTPPPEGWNVYVNVVTRGLGLTEPDYTIVLGGERSARVASGTWHTFEGVPWAPVTVELDGAPDQCTVAPSRSLIAEVEPFHGPPSATVWFVVTCLADGATPPFLFTSAGAGRPNVPGGVSQWEVSTGRLVRDFAFAGKAVAASSDGTRLYLKEDAPGPDVPDEVIVLDPTATPGNELVATVAALPPGREGAFVEGARLTPDETELWVNVEGGGIFAPGAVSMIDVSSLVLHRTFELPIALGPGAGINDIAFSKDGKKAYLSLVHQYGGGRPASVLVVDTRTLEVVEQFEFPANHVDIGLGPEGERLYAIDIWDNLKVILTATDEVERSLTLPHYRLHISPALHEAYSWPLSGMSFEVRGLPEIENVIAVIDFPYPPLNMSISPDGRFGFVRNGSQMKGEGDYLTVVDLEARQLLGRVWTLDPSAMVITGLPGWWVK